MGGREELESAIEAIMAAKREELGEPPTPEELLAFRDGLLDPAARRSVEARLAVYPDAARALADLAAFPEVEPAPGTPDLTEEEVEARWQALRQRMEEAEEPPPTRLEAFSPSPGRGEGDARGARGEGPARPSLLKLAAAVLLALGLGWSGGFLVGRGARAPLPDTTVNVTIAELMPVEEGGSRSPSPVEMPDGSEELVLVLGLVGGKDFLDYGAEILDADGVLLWSGEGLRPTALGTFQLSFRRDALPTGTYRIRLFGREGERKILLATYDLRLERSEPK